MRTHVLLSPVILAGAVAAQPAVDILYSNITDSSSATVQRAYSDAVVLWTPNGQRPFAQESHGVTATGSVRKMKARTVNGLNYLYWYDIISDDIWRGRDVNLNGVIDPTEFQQVFDHPTSSDGSLDENGGVWWNGIGATSIGQLWRFQDGNGDGDFMDAGESSQVVAGPAINLTNPPILGVSSNNVSSVVAMANGDCVWYPKGTTGALTHALIRSTAAGVHTLYMAPTYNLVSRFPSLPTNPDFGGALPTINANPLDRLAVDVANDAVFAAVNFTSAAPQQPWVFRCKDGNNDGDANDAGEVTLFYDGSIGPVFMTSIDDIEWLNGRLYVSHENPVPSGPCEFVELIDLNNDGDAMDSGEQRVLGSTSSAPLDDPTVIGISVAPAGFFSGPGCVNADLRNTGMSSAGGTLSLTFADIPPAQQSPTTLCVGVLSLTGDTGIPLPGGCIIGLFPDALTNATISFLIGGPPTGRSVTLPGLPYPPLPVGRKIYTAGFFVDVGTLSFTGVTHSAAIVVQ